MDDITIYSSYYEDIESMELDKIERLEEENMYKQMALETGIIW